MSLKIICEYAFPILPVIVAIFMLWKFPTGVGGDPFPYELGDKDKS